MKPLHIRKYLIRNYMISVCRGVRGTGLLRIEGTWFNRVVGHDLTLVMLNNFIVHSTDHPHNVVINVKYTNYQTYQILVNDNVIINFEGHGRYMAIAVSKELAKMAVRLGHSRDNISIKATSELVVQKKDYAIAIEQDSRERDQFLFDELFRD